MEDEEKKTIFKNLTNIWRKSIDFVDRLLWYIYEGTCNLIKWRKVIWHDRHWDHSYMFIIWKHKLDLMEYYFRNRGISTDANKDADNIHSCIEILDRAIKDNYSDIAFEEYRKKWKKEEEDEFNNLLKTGRARTMTPEQSSDFRNASQIEEDMKEKDLDKLFEILRKESRAWWD